MGWAIRRTAGRFAAALSLTWAGVVWACPAYYGNFMPSRGTVVHRVGGASPQARAISMSFEVEPPTSVALRAVYVRTGAGLGRGPWNVELWGRDRWHYVARLATGVTELTPNSWSRIELPTRSLPSGRYEVRLSPASGSAEMELLSTSMHEMDFRLGRFGYEGQIHSSGVSELHKAGWVDMYSSSLLVLELDEPDPWAPPHCDPADRFWMAGNPFAERVAIRLGPGEAATQELMLDHEWSFADQGIGYIRFFLDANTASSIEYELSGGKGSGRSGVLVGDAAEVLWAPAAEDAPDTVYRVTLRPIGGSVTLLGLAAANGALNECDPIARATFGGTRSRVVVGGGPQPEADLLFEYGWCSAVTRYADRDGDGFGDPASPIRTCIGTPGFVDSALDCDDGDPATSPNAMEHCNGRDDDCDGLLDGADSNLVFVPCELQAGVCAGAYTFPAQCVGGTWLSCEPYAYGEHYEPFERTRDGRDNDCDGLVDEPLIAECTSPQCNPAPAVGVAPAREARPEAPSLTPEPAGDSSPRSIGCASAPAGELAVLFLLVPAVMRRRRRP